MAKHLGYRDDGLFGDAITDPVSVAMHETEELENTHIADHLLLHCKTLLSPEEVLAVTHICENGPGDATEEELRLLRQTLIRVLDGRDFCKWLAPSPQHVVDAYISPFPDANARIDDSECSTYVIPDDAMPLTDEDDPEGTLWAWYADYTNTVPIEIISMREACTRNA